MSQLLQEVTETIRQAFSDDQIALTETSTADDVDGWDSLMHLNVVIALEKRFISFFPDIPDGYIAVSELAAISLADCRIGSLHNIRIICTCKPAIAGNYDK